MAFSENYRRQVALLISVLPHVAKEDCFALKGGTAINLFVRNMPRLSVDIDLAYLPVLPRKASLAAIDQAMRRIAGRVGKAIRDAEVTISEMKPDGAAVKLFIRIVGAQVKIEVTPVLRGCVYEPELRSVAAEVENEFGFAEIQVVSFGDLYAGKIVAALDRQHPRDLFDVRDLLSHEGIDDALRRAFIVYLLSHSRPMSEVLAANRKSITEEFLRGFEGMTRAPILMVDLITAKENLIAKIVGEMPAAHRNFLVTFEKGQPDWALLEVPGASDLPAVKWRQKNLDTLKHDVRLRLVSQLERVLFGPSK